MWVEIALTALVLVVVAQSIALVLLWRQLRAFDVVMRNTLASLGQQAVHACTDVPTSMVVTSLGQLQRRIAMLEIPTTATPRPSYELAQELAREGADAGVLVERCGLSRDEANLILQMHSVVR